MMSRRLRSQCYVNALIAFAGAFSAHTAQAITDDQLHLVRASASHARQVCLKEMHHDTDEFVECVDSMIQQASKSAERRLGIAYLGLVGCMSAARIATLHSDECSRSYLVLTDRTAKLLKAKDVELCSIVPGD